MSQSNDTDKELISGSNEIYGVGVDEDGLATRLEPRRVDRRTPDVIEELCLSRPCKLEMKR